MSLQQIIESTRANVRRAQANYASADWRTDRIKKPLMFYLIRDRRFDQQLRDQRVLLEQGQVVWGAVVQANDILFDSQGAYPNLPAAIIYSADRIYDDNPELLLEHAQNLFDLKGERCTPEMQAFADKLADEIVADLKLPIPTGFTEGAPCYYATMLIARKHLPGNHLANGFFPVLIAPEITEAVSVLPQRYWDDRFREVWAQA